MNDIEFRPCYRCGGKVTEDFLGRIRCTKCGYDFLTMTVDPDFEPAEEVCEFCAQFDFSTAKLEVDKYGARIALSLCNTKFDKDEQFKYCPMCGKQLTESETD